MACVLHELAHVFMDDTGCDHQAYTGLLSGRTAFTRSLDTPHERPSSSLPTSSRCGSGCSTPRASPGSSGDAVTLHVWGSIRSG